MERVMFQIKHNHKLYNKFILIKKEQDKEGKDVYSARELIASKDVHIEYYNKLFVEGDFDNTLSKMDFQKIINFMKKAVIITYIDNGFTEIEKILK